MAIARMRTQEKKRQTLAEAVKINTSLRSSLSSRASTLILLGRPGQNSAQMSGRAAQSDTVRHTMDVVIRCRVEAQCRMAAAAVWAHLVGGTAGQCHGRPLENRVLFPMSVNQCRTSSGLKIAGCQFMG